MKIGIIGSGNIGGTAAVMDYAIRFVLKRVAYAIDKGDHSG